MSSFKVSNLRYMYTPKYSSKITVKPELYVPYTHLAP